MNKETIEAHDQILLKKIRGIVEGKDKKSSASKPFWHISNVWIPILCTVLIGGVLIVSRQQPTTIASKNAEPASIAPVAMDASPVLKEDAGQTEKTDDQVMPPAAEKSETNSASAPIPIESAQPEAEAIVEAAPKPPEALPSTDHAAETYVEDQPQSIETSDLPRHIKISKIVSCSGVSDRQCVSPRTTFSLSDVPTPFVWMNVLSDTQPFTLTHVYYLNGHPYCEVPLDIRYPRMRTWSRITLDSMDQMGNWRVEVVADDGEILDRIEFTVGP